MSRFERMLTNVRQAYEASRESMRAARARAERENGPPPAAAPAPPEESEPQPPLPPPSRPSAEELVPRGLLIAAAWSWRLIVVAAVTVGLLWLADRFLVLVAPLMIALLLTGLLAPILGWVLKLGLHRSLAALLVLVIGLGAVGGTLTLVINQLIEGAEDLVSSAETAVQGVQEWLRGPPLEMTDADLNDLLTQAQDWVERNTGSLTEAALSTASGTVQFLTGLILALVATFFFLRDGPRIWRFLVGMLPDAARPPMSYAGDGAWRSLGGYVRATVLVAFVDAVGIGVGLWILQVPLALPLAALVFLGAFVPIVGAFVSGTLAVLVALVHESAPGLLEGGGPVKALMVLGLVLLVQQLEGNVLQPLIMSRAVKIHPLAVIVAVTAGILLAGIIGALVAVPIVAVLNTVVRRLNAYHRQHSPARDRDSTRGRTAAAQ